MNRKSPMDLSLPQGSRRTGASGAHRTFLRGLLAVLLVIISAAGAAPAVRGLPESTAATSISGDADYDPAAGGTPELSMVAVRKESASAVATSISGDADYDPAAGGTPELSMVAVRKESASAVATSISGDADYDRAAGGTPELSVVSVREGSASAPGAMPELSLAAVAAEIRAPVACGLPANEIARRNTRSISGGYSGDDDYDPAAGGTPELSLFAFVRDLWMPLAC